MKLRTTQNLMLAAAAVMAGTSHAATVTGGGVVHIGTGQGQQGTSTQNTVGGVSVTPGSEGYSLDSGAGDTGLDVGGLDQSFNGSIVDYAFYHSTNGTTTVTTTLAGASDEILTGTTSGNANSTISNDYLRIWDTTTPDANFLNPDAKGFGRFLDFTGTIDISGMTAGSLYVVFSGNGGTTSIGATLSGDGETDVVMTDIDFGASGNLSYIARIDFADAGAFDTLTYTYDDDAVLRTHRFAGVVLTGNPVPEPGSLALLGLGGLCMLRRRRSA